jgi:hypothetical protein
LGEAVDALQKAGIADFSSKAENLNVKKYIADLFNVKQLRDQVVVIEGMHLGF